MMNKIIRTTLIALLLTFAAHAAAQQGLQIATVFQKYGKQKGVTMVELLPASPAQGGCEPLYPLQNRKERFGYPYLYRRRTGCRRPDHHVIHEERIKNR